MHPHSSSTSSSEDDSFAVRRRAWRTLLWALLWLAALDIGASIAFSFPQDIRSTDPGKLRLFFDYGRSMEGRLRRMTRADPAATAPITLAGWYRPLHAVERRAAPGSVPVTVYGMSHAVRLADALHVVSPRYAVRSVGGPGATTNWSFGAYRRDAAGRGSRVVVLAIMSSTLPQITSMTPMTWNVSFPLAYTQDRYILDGGRLRVIAPPYDSFAGYVATLDNPRKWAAALELFARYDPFYDPLMFRATWLDHSTLVRLARRAWINRRDRETAADVLTARGFNPDSEAVRLANAIIAEFAAMARRNGQVPVIYIVNNYGYGDQLHRALRATLERDNIPYLSSETVVDPNDPGNYLPDTHFTDANDRKLARALDAIIAANQPPAVPAQR